MNRSEQHPDSELLDRLRAGLVDDPAEKNALEAHLADCADCRSRYQWPTLLRGDTSAVDRQLEGFRQQALQAKATRSRRRLLPLAAAAAVVLVAVAVVNLFPESDYPPGQLADNSSEVPDLYEDLDFYLWLADHKGAADSST